MVEEAGLQLPDFEESDFYVEQEQVRFGTTDGGSCLNYLWGNLGDLGSRMQARRKLVTVTAAPCVLHLMWVCNLRYYYTRTWYIKHKALREDLRDVRTASLCRHLVAGNDRACCWRGGILDSVHRKVLRRCGRREEANAAGAGLGKVSAARAVGAQVYSAPEYARVHRVSNTSVSSSTTAAV